MRDLYVPTVGDSPSFRDEKFGICRCLEANFKKVIAPSCFLVYQGTFPAVSSINVQSPPGPGDLFFT